MLNQIITAIKTTIHNKNFVKKHGNRFLTAYSTTTGQSYNGQVKSTLNPLNIKMKLASNGQIVRLKASNIKIINKDHKQSYIAKSMGNKPVIVLRNV
jgi:hypothetical protein